MATEKKKYKMRPARKDDKGRLQQVPIGFVNGYASALASEGEHYVTPAIHRAYMCGDIDIDDYPHERSPGVDKKGKGKGKGKKSRPKKPSNETTTIEPAPEPEPTAPAAADSE